MGAKAFKRTDPEFSFFGNFYSFAQAYWNPEKSEQYHREVIAASDKLWKNFCADGDGKPLDTVSAKRMEAIIKAFACFEEHDFVYDFTRFISKYQKVSGDAWSDCMEEANALAEKYCYDKDSWICQWRNEMITSYLLALEKEDGNA